HRTPAGGPGGFASGGGIINVNTTAQSGAVNSGVLTLNHSEINDNRAGGVGGGIANGVPSNNQSMPGGPLTLNHSQITGNAAALGGGGIFNVNASVTLSHSSITGNSPDNCEPTGTISGCSG